MNSAKLILAIVSGGVLLGTALGNMAYPEMKFAAGEDWRARYAPDYSSTSMQFVDAGPEDLGPTWYGPVYDGPNYMPAAFAHDQDWEYEHLMVDSYETESPYGSYDAVSYDDVSADVAPEEPAVPLAVERASEEAAEVAAEMLDLPTGISSGSAGETRAAPTASTSLHVSLR